MVTKSSLAIELSKLKPLGIPNIKLEQYPTDSESAASVLWAAYMAGDIEGKIIADLGCGNGILGIGAFILGAKKVYGIDIDSISVDLAKENSKGMEISLQKTDVSLFSKKVDTVITNPPFGSKIKGSDRQFLDKASTADVYWIISQNVSRNFILDYLRKKEYGSSYELELSLQLKQSMPQHRKKIHIVNGIAMRFTKNFK